MEQNQNGSDSTSSFRHKNRSRSGRKPDTPRDNGIVNSTDNTDFDTDTSVFSPTSKTSSNRHPATDVQLPTRSGPSMAAVASLGITDHRTQVWHTVDLRKKMVTVGRGLTQERMAAAT